MAAGRHLADRSAEGRQLCRDPYAALLADDESLAAASASPALGRSIWLRTRYIDDAVRAFVDANPGAAILLLGAGKDTRAIRLGVEDRPVG